MKVEKFPRILFQGKELLWDLRQVPLISNIDKVQIVIREGIDRETENKLRKVSPNSLPLVERKDFTSWGQWTAELLGQPSRALKVIGIVGTNGKTTTAALLRFLLVKHGKKVLELGTLGAQLWQANDNQRPQWSENTGFTSPEAHTLQALLRDAGREQVDFVVMEVTSHAVALGRVDGVDFDAAIFLNFSQDHLDFHKTLEEYKRVKKSFFTQHVQKQGIKNDPLLVINANDSVGAELAHDLGAFPHVALVRGEGYRVEEASLDLTIVLDSQPIQLPFIGHFQAENLLTSAHLLSGMLKLPLKPLLEELQSFPGIAGRMERVCLKYQGKERSVIVDFAHTPGALEKNLQTLKQGMRDGKLWLLFGCGGDRDALKRPLMGEIASRYVDTIVVTSDNPRSEDPQKIIDDIVVPLISKKFPFKSFVSRKEAMVYCLANMQEHDLCLVAGRGHEEFQLIGDKKIPFRDVEVLKSLSC